MSQSAANGMRMQFSVAGRTTLNTSRFTVKDCVFVPDGNACDSVDYAKCFRAPAVKTSSAHSRDISVRAASVLVLITLFVTGFSLLDLVKAKTRLFNDLSGLTLRSGEIAGINTGLALKLTQARDEARICYIASRELGMISAEGVEVIYLHAPDTRPDQSAGQTLPQSALQTSDIKNQ
jgi:hypothetical protein